MSAWVKSPALEPQDLHLLLDPRMGVVVAVMADGGEVFGGKNEVAHGEIQYS